MKNVFFVIAIFYAINLNSQTDLNYYFGNTNNFSESIPKHSEVIGHEVGGWHVTHDKLVQYMYALANASNRIKIKETGKTLSLIHI